MITDSLERIEIDADEEKALIRAAREKATVLGHSVPTAAALNAKERLIAAYAGTINRYAKQVADWEEGEAELLEAFLRAIEEYDFQSNNRLAHEIKFRFTNAIARVEKMHDALNISTRQKALFYQIYYKDAEGSWSRALQIAEDHPKMSRETFVAIAQALNVGVIADTETSIWNQGVAASDYEMVEFVQWLLGCLNERSRLVIELHYGFDGPADLRLQHGFGYNDDLSIPQISSLLNVHRQTAWRIHNEALDQMRRKLNADDR